MENILGIPRVCARSLEFPGYMQEVFGIPRVSRKTRKRTTNVGDAEDENDNVKS